jgi:6,7-dimethyl-8-ribityllumazine synthase
MKEIGWPLSTRGNTGDRWRPLALIHVLARKDTTMNPENTKTEQTNSALPGRRIAFVQARRHRDIVDCCRDAFAQEISTIAGERARIDYFEVPGAFEIPLRAKRLARGARYDAVVASALVVDGGIYRHEFVAQAVIDGLMQASLDTNVPVLSAVLTPHHFHSHAQHQAFFEEHFRLKGREVAQACMSLIDEPEYRQFAA